MDKMVWTLSEVRRELCEVAATADLDQYNRERVARSLRRLKELSDEVLARA